MCVTFCHRLAVLYWNHDDCSSEFCPLVGEISRHCHSCQYRREGGNICALTRTVPPATEGRRGCCHWNVELAVGPQRVTPEMLTPLGLSGSETVTDILTSLNAPYTVDPAGQVWVDPDRLGLPEVYGLGTEALAPEVLDWTGWARAWQQED